MDIDKIQSEESMPQQTEYEDEEVPDEGNELNNLNEQYSTRLMNQSKPQERLDSQDSNQLLTFP